MTDCIDREAVVDYIRYKVCQAEGNIEHQCQRGSCAYCGISEIMSDISCMPAADVQVVKRGKMIAMSDDEKYRAYKETARDYDGRCSLCNCCVYDTDIYCAECGAMLQDTEPIKG